MKQLVTQGIVLRRTDYGEADRIITFLTPDYGKLSLMAKGVRRQKSKLAGGVELFSVTDLTYLQGRGSIGTLVSARLDTYYSNIVKQLDRVQLGYELIRVLNKVTEDNPENEYFDLLGVGFAALNNQAIDLLLVKAWFQCQLLQLAGYSPNLSTDITGDRLSADKLYIFDFEAMTFDIHPEGTITPTHIKTLRLLFAGHNPQTLHQVGGLQKSLEQLFPIIQTVTATYLPL